MAAAFVAMNDTFGAVFDVEPGRGRDAGHGAGARQRAQRPVHHGHAHAFPARRHAHPDLRARSARRSARLGWNPALVDKPQTIEDLKWNNYFKEIFLDSDTKVALISSAPSDVPQDWFLTNEMTIAARERVNKEAGSKRMMAHAIFTPGQPGWLETLEHALAMKPDSIKGYTIGDNTNKDMSKYPWRMDDEKVTYKAYELAVKHGIKNICVHKGLFPASVEKQFPHLLAYCDVRDVGKAAKDWPQLNFVIYHSAYRHAGGGNAAQRLERVRADGPRLLGQRSRRDPAEVRRHQRLRRRRPAVRPERGRRAAARRGADGHPDQGPRRRPRLLGHRRDLDRLAAMADRGAAPARDPRGHAEEVRLRSRWAAPTGRSRPPSSAATTCASTACRSAPTSATGSPRMKEDYLKNGAARSNLRYGYARKPEGWTG